jgi:hypothetical protein
VFEKEIFSTNFLVQSDYLFDSEDNVTVGENIEIIKISNIENLIFYLEHYQLFFIT